MAKMFLSGNEAVAHAVRLAKPHVVSAYPITPQTTIVEAIAQMVADGALNSQYIHVESEHSALAAALGASMTGARTFTATSSQGLLYMAEVLTYVAGGRFPVVMANANRALALPWNIYGDQRDSLSLLDHGWIQAYAKDNQEAHDLILFAYRVAENARVMTPFMVNLDGFALTHTYESVDIPTQAQVDEFLLAYKTNNCFDFDNPKSIGYSAGPEFSWQYKKAAHEAMQNMWQVLRKAEQDFARIFGRTYTGGIEAYKCEDADRIIITLGSISALVQDMVDELRELGEHVGLLRIRYMRPFPAHQLAEVLKNAVQNIGQNAAQNESSQNANSQGTSSAIAGSAPAINAITGSALKIAVLEKDISFGASGSVYANVCTALHDYNIAAQTHNYIGGLGGADIKPFHIKRIFQEMDSEEQGEHDVNAKNKCGVRHAINEPIFIDAWEKEEGE